MCCGKQKTSWEQFRERFEMPSEKTRDTKQKVCIRMKQNKVLLYREKGIKEFRLRNVYFVGRVKVEKVLASDYMSGRFAWEIVLILKYESVRPNVLCC